MSVNRISVLVLFASVFCSSFCSSAFAEYGRGFIGKDMDPQTGEFREVYKDWKEGVILDPTTGDYTVTYKAVSGNFYEVVLVPATKIAPDLKSKFKLNTDANTIRYEYKLKNEKNGKQPIVDLITHVTSVKSDSLASPRDWNAMAVPAVTTPDTRLSWGYWGKDLLSGKISGLAPGRTVEGLAAESADLPGMAVIEIRGGRSPTTWLGHTPEITSPVGKQLAEIESNDFVPRFAAVPKIPVGQPFDPVLTLTGIQQHLNQDLISMKLIDPVFAAQLDRGLQAALDAAKLNNAKALKDHLKDLRKALKNEHGDVDKEDGDEDEDEANNKVKKARLIDKLAARVLAFDLKYVQKRVGD